MTKEHYYKYDITHADEPESNEHVVWVTPEYLLSKFPFLKDFFPFGLGFQLELTCDLVHISIKEQT